MMMKSATAKLRMRLLAGVLTEEHLWKYEKQIILTFRWLSLFFKGAHNLIIDGIQKVMAKELNQVSLILLGIEREEGIEDKKSERIFNMK